MRTETEIAVGITVATGLLLIGVAAASLQSGSRLRRLYGIDPSDDEAVRSNAVVVGICGVGTLALAAAVAFEVPGRVIGVTSVFSAAGLCVILGWLIRYRDRRELLTSPDVERETARRLGASAMFCGLLVLPLAPAIWFEASAVVIVAIGVGGSFLTFFAIAFAHR